MNIQRLAAFTRNGEGGNPAGVVLCDALPDAGEMQDVAIRVGYSETVFAAPSDKGHRVRFFAPGGEVPFCGHATIALGAALGAARGVGVYPLELNDTQIEVTAFEDGAQWGARLVSPRTSHAVPDPKALSAALTLFALERSDLDPSLPPAVVQGGAAHLVIALGRHGLLQCMHYDFEQGAALMRSQGWVTINLIWRENAGRIHSRNAFAGHGVYEDPATGAAAAALGGYLRDAQGKTAPFEVVQGVEAGHPSLLHVAPRPGRGARVEVSGTVRPVGQASRATRKRNCPRA